MSAFIRDEDGVFISLATVTKIRREGSNLRTREENPQTPWIAETREGEQHRFWVRDDEEGVERMLATVIPAARTARKGGQAPDRARAAAVADGTGRTDRRSFTVASAVV